MIADFRFGTTGALRAHLLKSTTAKRKSKMQYQEVHLRPAVAELRPRSFAEREIGGKGIRTPDFQLAKLALYQLSYAPTGMSNFDCRFSIARQ